MASAFYTLHSVYVFTAICNISIVVRSFIQLRVFPPWIMNFENEKAGHRFGSQYWSHCRLERSDKGAWPNSNTVHSNKETWANVNTTQWNTEAWPIAKVVHSNITAWSKNDYALKHRGLFQWEFCILKHRAYPMWILQTKHRSMPYCAHCFQTYASDKKHLTLNTRESSCQYGVLKHKGVHLYKHYTLNVNTAHSKQKVLIFER
jgi:hypothetical protein